ncbi:MAG TPA: carboxypeptidase regulatory-like domain-containing protein [Terriglobales bacterium]
MGALGAGSFKRCVLLVAGMALLTSVVVAQSFRGSIRGKVSDPHGALVSGAKITAKNSANGLERSSVTGTDGGYVLAELPAGEYTVSADAPGFSPVAQNVIVAVGADTNANFDLTQLKKTVEEVTVTAQAPVIDETRDTLGEVVERKLVTQLPLNGRDFGKLVALVPGVTVEPAGVAGTQYGFGQFNINGNRDRSNNYTVDGTDNNDPFLNNSALNQVGITGAPATLLPIDAIQEFNLQSNFPAEYGRDSGSVVNIITRSGTNQLHGSVFEFLRNSAMDSRNYFNTEPRKTVFQNNQFGASLGGPIIHDKTFFFGAYEGQRENVGSDFLLGVPTTTQISEAQELALSTGQITAINPALIKVLNFYPVSNSPTIASVVRDHNDLDNFIAKIDENLSEKEQFGVRYAFGQSNQVFPLGNNGGFGKGSRLPEFAQTSPTRVQVVSASLLSTISGTKINEVRFGYNRFTTSFSSLDANFDPASIGLNMGTGKLGLPEFDFSTPSGELENLGATGYSIPRGRTSQTYQILDNFTWIRGRSTFKFGGEFHRANVANYNDNLERGIFDFSPTGPGFQLPGHPYDPVVDVLANFFLGNTFPSVDTGNTHRTTINNGLSFFAQDDFRATSRLTLNFGLRWEYFGPLSEANNLISNLNASGTALEMVGSGGVNSAYNRDLHNFGPRVGFAWNVAGNTIIRAGYGLYYDYVPQDLLVANFTSSAGLVTNPIGPEAVIPMNFNEDAFNGATPGVAIMTPATVGPYPIFAVPRNFPTPYSQNFNFNIQQRLAQNMSFEVGYVGSKGVHLVRLFDGNQPDENYNFPNPNFTNMDFLAPISSSNFNSLQTTFRIQGKAGWSGFASYNYSKSLDDASDGIDFTYGAAFPQNSYNLPAEYGPSTFDTRQRFTAAFSYDVPTWHAVPPALGSGWALNWVATLQSGRPIPIVTVNDTTGRFYFNQRPNVVAGVNPILPNWNPETGYLNPNAFSQPAFGTFGDLGRDSVFGPGYKNLDFSITKMTQIYERLNLQLRAEFFNVLNHPNFALPNGAVSPGVGPAGLISQTPDVAQGNPGLGGGGPRVVQLGAKFTF